MTAADALEGARHIVAERISEDAEVRKAARQLMFDEDFIMSSTAFDAVDEREKFKMYYEYREPVKSIPSHRMLRFAVVNRRACRQCFRHGHSDHRYCGPNICTTGPRNEPPL